MVYLAREVRLDRLVAMKVLRPDLKAEARASFLEEARTAARLSHPNIVPILAIEESGPFVFFTMPYIAGGTIGERVRASGPLLTSEAVRILRDVAWALDYSHGQGVIHRDIKPDNILIERATQRTLVADFGIAVTTGLPRAQTALIGTPAFMSPEQIRGQGGDPRSDVYALAGVAYYLMSGRTPFEAPTTEGLLLAHLSQLPIPIRTIAPQVPSDLAELIMRGLCKAPEDRLPTAAVVAAALSNWLGEQHRPVPPAIERFLRQLQESRPVALLYSTVAALLLTIQFVLALPEPWRLSWVLKLATLFALPPLVILLARVRGLVARGHDRSDLVQVLHAAADREEQQARQLPLPGVQWKRVALRWSVIVGLASGLLWLPGTWFYPGPLFLVNLLSAACVVVLSDQVSAGGRERRRARIWSGRVGAWLFRVGSFGVRRKLPPNGAGGHRTEVALGLSAMALFDRLPVETRREIRELPAIVQKLEEDANRIRQQRSELRQLEGKSTDSQVSARAFAAEERLSRRHTEVVTALEGIRVSLLRLHVGGLSVESFTTDLGDAGDLADRLKRLAEAHEEVERLSA